MATGLRQQTFSGVVWSFFERFSLQGVQFVIGVIMARLLTPADYGIVGMLAVFMAVSQVFIDGGFSSALIQSKHKSEKDFSTVFYVNFTISILFYLLLFMAAPYISAFYGQPLLTSVTRVYALNLIINSFVAVNKTKLVINVDFKTQSKISIISAIISGSIGIFYAAEGYGVWALVIQMMTLSVFNVILSFYFVKWYPKLMFSVDSFRRLFSYGSKLLIASLISSIYANLYNLVIGKKFSSTDLGLYTKANHLAQFTGSNISGIFSRVCFPILSKIQDDDEKLKLAYSRFIQVAAFIMFPLILVLCSVANPLVLFLLGEKWSDCVILLQILLLVNLFNGIIVINLNLLYVKGRSDLVLRLEIIKKSIAFLILFISVFFSLEAICIGQFVYSLIAFYLNTIYTKKILNYGFIEQVKDILPYFLLSLLLFCEGFVICHYIHSCLLVLLLSGFICAFTYILASNMLKLSAFVELREMLSAKAYF